MIHGRASKTRLNGVSVARRNRVKPPAVTAVRSCASVASVPSTVCPEAMAFAGYHDAINMHMLMFKVHLVLL